MTPERDPRQASPGAQQPQVYEVYQPEPWRPEPNDPNAGPVPPLGPRWNPGPQPLHPAQYAGQYPAQYVGQYPAQYPVPHLARYDYRVAGPLAGPFGGPAPYSYRPDRLRLAQLAVSDPHRFPGPDAPGQRGLATAAHWSALASLPIGLTFVGPLITRALCGAQRGFAYRHSVASLNFQLSMLVYAAAGTFASLYLVLVTLFVGLVLVLPAMLGFLVFWLVSTLTGLSKASRGEEYDYPLTIRFLR